MPQVVASRYARALVDAVVDPAAGIEPRQALAEIRQFDAMLQESPELRNVLLSPAVTLAKKRAVVGRLADSISLNRLVRNFIYVILDRGRAGILNDIADAFEIALDEHFGVVRADVKSAAPLSDRQQADLQQELSRLSGKQVRCDFSTDPELIAGVVARVGSTVYDGSVRSQLENLRERLVAR
jgi:F-type H+-transporting ATPase subunit delta